MKCRYPILFDKESKWNKASGLAGEICSINETKLEYLCAEYQGLIKCAPRRSCHAKCYFVVEHTGLVPCDKNSNRHEEHYAIALWNLKAKWPRPDGGSFTLLDYQFPLRAQRSDKGIGKIDLLGVTGQGQLMVIELKVKPNNDRGDSPLSALMQGLRYAAIMTANQNAIAKEAIQKKVMLGFDGKITKQPPIVQLLAPKNWWEGWLDDATQKATGDWGKAFAKLIEEVREKIGISVECMALGEAKCAPGANGNKPTLESIPALYPVQVNGCPPVGNALHLR